MKMMIIPRKDIGNGGWEQDSFAAIIQIKCNRMISDKSLLVEVSSPSRGGQKGAWHLDLRRNGHRFIGAGYVPGSKDEVVRGE
jgi:hypothetical protein